MRKEWRSRTDARADEAERFGHRAEKSSRAFGRLRRSALGRDEPLAALWPPLDVLRRDSLLLGLIREQTHERIYLRPGQTRRARDAQELGADGRAQISRHILRIHDKRQHSNRHTDDEKEPEGHRATHESSIPREINTCSTPMCIEPISHGVYGTKKAAAPEGRWCVEKKHSRPHKLVRA